MDNVYTQPLESPSDELTVTPEDVQRLLDWAEGTERFVTWGFAPEGGITFRVEGHEVAVTLQELRACDPEHIIRGVPSPEQVAAMASYATCVLREVAA